jgi:hypothetical protein
MAIWSPRNLRHSRWLFAVPDAKSPRGLNGPRGLSYVCRVRRRMACALWPAGWSSSLRRVLRIVRACPARPRGDCRAPAPLPCHGRAWRFASTRIVYGSWFGNRLVVAGCAESVRRSWSIGRRTSSRDGGATEREGGAGTPSYGSGPVRLAGGSLESPGAGFSSRCRAMGHSSSCRPDAVDPRGAGFGTGPHVRAGRSM